MRAKAALRTGLTFGLAVLLASLPAADAQQAAGPPRIGFLSASSLAEPRTQRFFEAFRQGLRDLGYVEGQSIAIEPRFAAGKYDRLPSLAAELVSLRVTVIVAYGTTIQPARQATQTIPIVGAVMQDPVASGFIASLAHPGGNTTGVSTMIPEMIGKQLEILKEVAPRVSRVVVLRNPDNSSRPDMGPGTATARTLGVQLESVEARTPVEIDNAFSSAAVKRAGAVIVLPDPVLLDHGARIADLAIRRRLPTISSVADHAQAGVLIVYGPSIAEGFRRAATYVDKILKGAKPGDLPVEQPTRFELTVNLRTAKALGLQIPRPILTRADQVIE